MKRREFFEKAGIGSAALVSIPVLGDGIGTNARAQEHSHPGVTGPLAAATVTFGGWQTSPPFDRFGALPNDRTRNHHALTPAECTIQAGGTVNFIIGGFHNVLVYGDGTQPADIDTTKVIAGAPPLIDDPTNRIYRGIDPRVVPAAQDRVETVHFPEPGRYLVICGVLPHFNDGMIGFVRVLS